MYDVCIIGAGIVGAAIARRLSAYTLRICVLEAKDDVGAATTKANSAIVHGGYAESHAKLKGRLCYKGRVQFEKLNRELHFGFDPIGSMVITHDADDLPKLKELMENGHKNGLADLEILEHDEILAREPHINPKVIYALYCKGAGVCSPYEMCQALMENAITNGVELKLMQEVQGITKRKGHFEITTQSGQSYQSKVIINCAGIYAAHITSLVTDPGFSITPRSGAYLLFKRGSGSVINHVLFQMPTRMGKGILVTPTYYGNLLVGPDAIDTEDASIATDAKRLVHIYQEALKTTEYINPKDFIRSFAGLRAVASTQDFEIAMPYPGFIHCAGIQSPGLTSSPAIADMVLEMLGDKLFDLHEKADFMPERTPIIERKELMDPRCAEELVKLQLGNPERLVCRCEQVRERTIKDALSRNIAIQSIDAIKRRTRAGMGYCQGSFCRARVAELLSNKLGHAVDPSFDIEHSGVSRVGKSEFLDYLKSLEDHT